MGIRALPAAGPLGVRPQDVVKGEHVRIAHPLDRLRIVADPRRDPAPISTCGNTTPMSIGPSWIGAALPRRARACRPVVRQPSIPHVRAAALMHTGGGIVPVPHETALIATIAIGLAFALIGGFIAVRLHLPPLVGYLVAGIAVGPFTPGFVADPSSPRSSPRSASSCSCSASGCTSRCATCSRCAPSRCPARSRRSPSPRRSASASRWLWGWSLGAGLVFGLALSVASTVVLLRALEARGLLESVDGRIAVGWLIVEDLVIVLALVLLPALAGPLGGRRRWTAAPRRARSGSRSASRWARSRCSPC